MNTNMLLSVPSAAGDALAREAERYLAAVEVFRTEGCDPIWRPEERAPTPSRSSRSLSVPITAGGSP
jgi:hypothetical protein